MVCDDSPGPDGPLPPETIALLHQIRREALVTEGELQQMLSSPALTDAMAAEMTQRLAAIKALAGGLLGGG
jgi:hypothetical protein